MRTISWSDGHVSVKREFHIQLWLYWPQALLQHNQSSGLESDGLGYSADPPSSAINREEGYREYREFQTTESLYNPPCHTWRLTTGWTSVFLVRQGNIPRKGLHDCSMPEKGQNRNTFSVGKPDSACGLVIPPGDCSTARKNDSTNHLSTSWGQANSVIIKRSDMHHFLNSFPQPSELWKVYSSA